MAEKKVVIYSPLNNKIHPETEAEVVLITDLNNNYTSSNVEGALNEIGFNLSTKAPLASPSFTGTPTAPTASAGTNTTQIATTAFVQSAAYTHPTTAGNKHIPAGGSANQVLVYSADGTAVWSDPPSGGSAENLTMTTLSLGNYQIHFDSVSDKLQIIYTG